MGFSASLLVLFPRKNTVYEQHPGDNKLYRLPLEDRLKIIHARPSKSYTVWEGEHIIDFDYITRLEKVTNKRDFGDSSYGGIQLAGICCFSWLHQKMVVRLHKEKSREVFAPPFTLSSEFGYSGVSVYRDHELLNFHNITDGAEFLKPKLLTLRLFAPDIRDMQGHNRALQMPDTAIPEYIKNRYSFVCDVPLMWISCRTASHWFREMERKRTPAWMELQKDHTALVRVKAWISYIHEVSKANARLLFYFPQ